MLSIFTHLIIIDTTDVQSESVEELDNSSLLLKCVFVEGSSARGCQLNYPTQSLWESADRSSTPQEQ